ncbi:uncharacterized protein LOC116253142 isoform X1 [Nymphaea colorata]|nr:uncharacterized protein LOC116253142 isoform X1 [Nymphaea colorata]XP_049933170.1 uncharacterized protein LOC116253142 isoform X1 [Nymphaea colorata]
MQLLKIGSALQTFAVASHNQAFRKKAGNRKTRDERKALIESFITQYRSLNNGSYPSLRLTHKEVGGSFYTVREITREIKQETENSSLSILPVEEQALHNPTTDCTMGSLQAERLNLATLSSTSDCTIGQEVCLSDSEDNISISSTGKDDCNKEESLCAAVLGEDLIDEENEATLVMEQKEQEQISVEGTESFPPVAEGGLGEGMTLASSTDSPDPTFYSHNHTIEVEKSCDFLHKDGDLLNCGKEDQLMSNLPKEVKTGESSFICEQLENSCLAELKATDSMLETDRAINDHENGTTLSDCDANSTISYHKPEAAQLVNFLTGKNDELSGQAVQGHPSSISSTLSANFSVGGFLEMEESLKQNGTSGPANISVEDKINSNESISPSSSHKKKNLGLENVRGVNSDPCFMLTPGSGSMSSQITNRPENCDSQIVSSDNDDFSEQEVNLHELVPVSELETKPKPKTEEVKHVGGKEAYYIASTRHSQNGDIVASHAEAGAMIASTSNSISSNSPVPATRASRAVGQRTVSSARKEKEYEWTQSVRLSRSILYTHGKFPMKRKELNITRRAETNSFLVVIKAFLGAFFQVLNRIVQAVSSKPRT